MFFSVFRLLCLCARLFICALWSPAGKRLTSWLSFVVSNCDHATFPLVSWVRCGAWLYLFLIDALFLTLYLVLFRCAVLSVVYSFRIISPTFDCLVISCDSDLCLFLMVTWVRPQCVIVVFPGHTHLLFCVMEYIPNKKKIRKLCLRSYDKPSKDIWISQYYNVSFFL